MNDENRQEFLDTMNYPNLLMWRINDVHNAIKTGRDGSLEINNLISSLTSEIREPIEQKLLEIHIVLEAEIEKIKTTEFPHRGEPGWISRYHRNSEIEGRCGMLNRETMLKTISIIMDRLKEMGLLTKTKRQREQGGID
jgi:hypothetical protein